MMKRALIALLLTLPGCATRHVLFDDFNYAAPEDVARNGWIIRTEVGWPGVQGSAWGKESFSIVQDPERAGNVLLRMTSTTDGTGEHTRQSQLCQQRKFLEGTYAARVRFTDQPAGGPTGDQIVETFYFISPQKAPMDPEYGEIDFEYLPNGGWNHVGPTFFFTTWFTFRLDPWFADNVEMHRPGGLDGWHTLITQVGNGLVRYFVDGQQVAQHGGKFYPRSVMSMNFNLWFTREGLIPGNDTRTWIEEIDWVYFRGGRVQSPRSIERTIADLRRRSIQFKDTVPASGLTSPCNF